MPEGRGGGQAKTLRIAVTSDKTKKPRSAGLLEQNRIVIFNEAEKKTIQIQPLVWETIDPQRERALVGIGKGHPTPTRILVQGTPLRLNHPLKAVPLPAARWT